MINVEVKSEQLSELSCFFVDWIRLACSWYMEAINQLNSIYTGDDT